MIVELCERKSKCTQCHKLNRFTKNIALALYIYNITITENKRWYIQ